MMRIVSIIIILVSSFLSSPNTKDLALNEGETDQEWFVNETVDIQQENSIEETKPKKIQESPTTDTNTNQNTSTNWWEYPEDIKETTRNGDDLLVLVNKEYKLPSTYAPSDLVKVGEDVIRRGSNYNLRSILIDDLRNLVNDSKADGIDLSIVSAYRSYSTQESTYNYWVNYNGGCVSCADKISARAGHSQHQLGTTLDFSSSEVNDTLGIKFGDTEASTWLKENAYKYGFVLSFPKGYESVTGYSYEPWHYRYIGRSNALLMKNSGMILEDYLRTKN